MNLSAAAKIAIIGVQAADSSSSGSPKDDHAGYFTEVMGVFQKISDLPWNPTLNWSDNYLSLNKNFGDYKIGASSNNYSTPERVEFVKDVIAIAKRSSDKSPDVETADMLFIVVPPDTHSSLVGQANDRFEVQVGKKNSIQVSILHNWKNYWDSGAAYRFPTGPAHGLFHLGFSIPDHYGDRYNIPYRSDFGDFGPGGTGHWGNMSGAHMDWLAWDKWVARLISDRQVICNSGSGTYWLRPSTIKGELQKLLVIPTGDYTAIAVESVRASGYNMKLADKFLGALVYTINTNEKILGKGIEVIRPANRIGAISTTSTKAKGEFGLSDAALKQGESLNVSGYRIEVIESGKFGDVIRVIKV
jgi:hypothetical protein